MLAGSPNRDSLDLNNREDQAISYVCLGGNTPEGHGECLRETGIIVVQGAFRGNIETGSPIPGKPSLMADETRMISVKSSLFPILFRLALKLVPLGERIMC
jgi:hypothetical protein